MANAIEILKKDFVKVVTNIDQIVIAEYKEESEEFAKQNRRQLEEGKDAKGENLPNYAPTSKAPKAPGKIKLFDSGDYYKGINYKFDQSGVQPDNTDSKKRFLDLFRGKFPTLGLTTISIGRINNIVIPNVIERLRKIL